jgi:GNAT superfamily N-acetyltransferase
MESIGIQSVSFKKLPLIECFHPYFAQNNVLPGFYVVWAIPAVSKPRSGFATGGDGRTTVFMAVIRHVLPVVSPPTGRLPAAEWAVFLLDSTASAAELGPLVGACNALQDAGPRLSVAGIAGDLAGRAGRTARGFVAQRVRRTGPDEAEKGLAACLGLAVLIDAHGGRGRRFSLATLLVHPNMRRRGIAAALLRHTLAHVRSCGGTEVSVETLSSWPAATAFWQALGGRES